MCKLEILYDTCTDLNIYSGRGSGKGSKGILQWLYYEDFISEFSLGIPDLPLPTSLDPVITGRMLIALLEWGGDINSITVI